MSGLIVKILKPQAWVSRTILLVFLGGFLWAGYAGYLQPVKTVLDAEDMSLLIGSIRISPYTLVKAIFAIITLFWLAGLFSDFGEKRIRALKQIGVGNRALIAKVFQIGVYFVAFLIGLDALGVELAALTVFGGAVGIGLGFGLQKIASNFVSGLILLFEKSVEEEDLIELENGVSGFVRSVGARYTLIETFEGREIMLPNENFITNSVTNWTYSNTKGRVDIPIGVAYGSDLEEVKNTLLEAATEHPRCSKDPKPEVLLENFGESSVDFMLQFWVDDIIEGRKRPRSEVLFSIARKFAERGIEIPFPQRVLHMVCEDAKK